MNDGHFRAFLIGDMPNYFEFFRRVRKQRFWDRYFFPDLRRKIQDEIAWIRGD